MSNDIKHVKLSNIIEQQILKGEYQEGEKLPSENQLAQDHKISRHTVRQAISTLESKGLVVRINGSGTFVKREFFKKRNNTNAIGFIGTMFDDYVLPSVIHGIDQVLKENNYCMKFGITYGAVDVEAQAIGQMIKNGVDGLIIEGIKTALPNPNSKIFNQLKNENIPYIFVNGYYKNVCESYIGFDDFNAGRIACEELIKNGHTKIGAIFKSDDIQGHRRYEGYCDEMQKHGLDIDQNKIIWFSIEDYRYFFKGNNDEMILERFKGVSAIVCYNDQFADKLHLLFTRNGIKVPEDISIVGIDNSKLAERSDITSVIYPGKDIGEKAARSILKMLNRSSYKINYEFAPELFRRSSVKKI